METYNIIVSILFIIIVMSIFLGIYLYFSEEEKVKQETCNLSIIKENKPTTKKYKKNTFFSRNKGKEVFNISNNVFSYDDAEAVCKSYDSKLASYNQVKDAYKKGAEWCSYGWSKNQLALFPTQKKTYEKLQKGSKHHKNDCGRQGVNGGYFQNPDLKFGVNCYGVKPKITQKEKNLLGNCPTIFPNEEEKKLYYKIRKFKQEKDEFTVMPFNGKRWNN
jgi:hypothetical protein